MSWFSKANVAQVFIHRQSLPVILQTEVAECGLACLAMIAACHGHDVDLPGLRRRFPISLKGATLARLIDIAQRMGLHSRPLRLEMEYLPQLKTPCILHWDMNHFVVLKRVTARGLQIHDPGRGAHVVSLREAGERFTGIALELTPVVDFVPPKARERISLRALAGRIDGLAAALVHVAALAFAFEVFGLVAPLYLQWVLDHVLVSGDYGQLDVLALGFLLAVGLQAMLSAARGWAISGIGATVGAQWAANLFGHLLRLPLEYFEKRSAGDLLSRFASLQSIQQTLTGNFVESILDGLTASCTLVLLALYSPRLTVVVVVGFSLYGMLRWLGYRRLESIKEEQLTHLARQQTQLIESIRGVQTIKLATSKRIDRRGWPTRSLKSRIAMSACSASASHSARLPRRSSVRSGYWWYGLLREWSCKACSLPACWWCSSFTRISLPRACAAWSTSGSSFVC